MLTQIRERASGWIAWVIVVLISIPFALWGIQSYFENPSEIPVATVNGDPIPFYAYQNRLSRERQALLQQAAGNYDPALLDSEALRTRVVEAMISSQLVVQYIDKQNYRLSNARLKQRIESTPAFLRDGQFDPTLYRARLRANGVAVHAYETSERQNIAIGQLSSAVSDSAFVTAPELDRLLQLQTQTRKTNYVILPGTRFESEITIEAADVEQHYQDNLFAYQVPARIKLEYIELSVDQLASGIVPSDSDINDIYEQTIERYKQAEIRKASHILFSVDEDVNESQRDEIQRKAESVLAEAKSGADFADLAKQHSDDPGSKDNGGDLGVVTQGQMVAPFEDAVFAMTAEEIRGPIKTQFGYHIIKLTELTEERQKPLTEVREQVIEEAQHAQAENLFAERSEAFQNLVFEYSNNLAVAAEELGLEIKHTDWFNADQGTGLAEEAQVRSAAFSEEVLNDGLNSAALELGFDRLVAIRKNDYEDARVKPFDEVRAEIEQHLKSQKSLQKTNEFGTKLANDLNAGRKKWNTLLEEEKLEAEALAETRDQVPQELAALRDSVFSHHRPPPDTASYNSIDLGNGDYALYELKEVTQGNAQSVPQSQRDRFRQQLLARNGSGLYQQLLQNFLHHSEVSVNQEQLQKSTAYQ